MDAYTPTPLYDLVGVGRAYSDVLASVSADFLEQHGIPVDAGKSFDEQTLQNIQHSLPSYRLLSGGSVANTLSGFAALQGRTGFFGKVAKDQAGKSVLDDLNKRQIDILGQPLCPDAPLSATCLVLITDDGKRSFAYNKGCADNFTVDDFEDFDFDSTRQFLIEGHLLTNSPATAAMTSILSQAKNLSCLVAVTLSDIASWTDCRPQANLIAANAGLIIGNKDEVAAFRSVVGKPSSDKQIIVTTNGAQGAQAKQGANECRVAAQTPDYFENTVGAGDQFTAGFLRGLSLGLSLDQSLHLAVNCATAILSETGARPATGQSWQALFDTAEQ